MLARARHKAGQAEFRGAAAAVPATFPPGCSRSKRRHMSCRRSSRPPPTCCPPAPHPPREDGTFVIAQFTDMHYGQGTRNDLRTDQAGGPGACLPSGRLPHAEQAAHAAARLAPPASARRATAVAPSAAPCRLGPEVPPLHHAQAQAHAALTERAPRRHARPSPQRHAPPQPPPFPLDPHLGCRSSRRCWRRSAPT